jgi:hypothetical protein
VTFEGLPDAPEAYVPIDPARRLELRVSVAGSDGWTPVRALTAPAGERTLVRLVLPSTLGAGETEAVVEVGDERFPALIRTVEHVELSCSPSSLDVVADERGSASATLQVVNTGNVAVDLPDIAAFGLMADGGVEAAVGAGLMTKDAGVERFGRMADALAERHGGLVRVTLTSSESHLEPGAATTIDMSLRFSAEAAANQRYHGVLPLHTLRVPVRVRTAERVPEPTPSDRPRSGRSPSNQRSPRRSRAEPKGTPK